MAYQLRQLEAFHAVIARGNVTKAAQSLEISQPAVSRLIADLRDALGFQLFERVNRQLLPTEEAKTLFNEVDRVLGNLNQISKLAHNIHNSRVGHLRLACLPGFATSLLPRLLAEFLRERADVTLTLEPDRPERIVDWIVGHQFDIGITSGFTGHPAIEHEQLKIRSVCILPKHHPLAKKSVITPKDLNGIPMILSKRDSFFHHQLRAAFTSSGAELNSWVEARQFGTACIMVSRGVGVAVVSEIDALEYPDLEVRPFKPATPHIINILLPANVPRSTVTTDFIDAFKQSIKPFQV